MSPSPLYLPILLLAGIVFIQLLFHLTAYWYATWSKALLWAAHAGLLFLVSQVLNRRAWIRVFGFFCAGYGFLLSLFAIVQQFTWNGKIYWVVPNRYGGWVYGPYVNHAHYAGLMEMLVPIPIMFAITDRLRRPVRAFLLFAAIVMSSTIFLSQSLGGMIAFAVELAVLVVILLRKQGSFRKVALLGLVCIILTVWLVWVHPVGLMDRLARLLNPIADAGATGRIAILKDSIKMAAQRPLLGWGLGTFPDVYPSYRSFFTNFWVNEAHNDFVQILVETGICGFALAITFLFFVFRAGVLCAKHWRGGSRSSIVLAAFVGCIGFSVHSLFDFNLQIPANAAFFFALSALVAVGGNTSDDSQKSIRT